MLGVVRVDGFLVGVGGKGAKRLGVHLGHHSDGTVGGADDRAESARGREAHILGESARDREGQGLVVHHAMGGGREEGCHGGSTGVLAGIVDSSNTGWLWQEDSFGEVVEVGVEMIEEQGAITVSRESDLDLEVGGCGLFEDGGSSIGTGTCAVRVVKVRLWLGWSW